MSLLSEAMEPFVFVEKTRQSDNLGGYTVLWTEGAEFQGVAHSAGTALSKIADALTERVNCTITTSKAVELEAMDVVKRVSDGQYFRVTSTGVYKKTPGTAGLDMRNVSAEIWKLPDSE